MNLSPEMLAAPKSGRYRIVSFLGRGATSLVYKAVDLEKNMQVALKTIRFQEQDEIYRIKQEFRFFRDFYHQNLVMFYDLHVEDHICFFTMEFVEGRDFIGHACGDSTRLRDGFGQLLHALAAVHDSGRLHRDLKPGNIVVEPSGRVVLLDFGLAYEAQGSIRGETQWLGGTPAYMAPELSRGEAATPASDLYGLGVILYEGLTGKLPYPDTAPVQRHEAQKTLPPDPRDLQPDAPADLAALALRLLAFDPADRPSLAELRRAVHADPARAGETHRQGDVEPSAGFARPPFIGRAVELAQLKYAWARALDGRRVAVHIKGVSGVGKTTLIERFLDEARLNDAAFVIYSRCHPQEAVRYNALDALVDQLSRHLARERPERLKTLTPDDLPALLTMFPVLARIPWPQGDEPPHLPNDPRALARLGMKALGQLVGAIARRRPIAIWIDDLQWSDSGSLPILDALGQAAGEGRPILTIFSYRSDLVTPGSVAAELEARGDGDVEVERMSLAPLKSGEVLDLMTELSGAAPDPDFARAVAEQSAGLPFFVLQFAAERSASAESPGERLARRIGALTPHQPLVLEIVSVAARPLEEGALVRILGRLSASARDIYRLLNQNLLRRAEARGRGAIETYHDVIRVAVLSAVPEDLRRERHRAIAETLAAGPDLDHAVLVEHFLGAGESERAADHAIFAGREARERLLFSQAVEFFALAARLRDPLADGAALAIEYAEALTEAGRSSQAADMFAAAAKVNASDPARAARLTDSAAGQMLYCGRLREGFDAYRGLFGGLGLDFPQTHARARRLSLLNRLAVLTGANRLSRGSGDGAASLARLDTLWASGTGFAMLDYVVGDAIISRYLREATATGEPVRLARALGLEAAVMAAAGRGWSFRRAATLLERAQTLTRASREPYEQLVLGTCQASVAWHKGRWREAIEVTREALARYRAEPVGYRFEVTISGGLLVSALVLSGQLPAARDILREILEDAETRGDGYVQSSFNLLYCIYLQLADDEPQTALKHADAIVPDLPDDRFTSLHWGHYLSAVNALVYAGRGWEAFALVERRWPILVAAGFPQLGLIAVHAHEIRARAALAASRAGEPPQELTKWSVKRLLADADAQARAIAHRKGILCAAPLSATIRSGIARRRGEDEAARRGLEQAAAAFDAADMALYAAAARAGAGGSSAPLEEAGVKRPDRYADFLIFAL